MTLYSLVAWPPPALTEWLLDTQRRLGVAGYGPPHLNLRTPFQWDGEEADLAARFRLALADVKPFEARVRGWTHFPHVFLLELERTRALMDVHERALAVEALPGGERDAGGFLPHVTLALGVCDWAEADYWAQIQALSPPVMAWEATELALTREHQGDLLEVRRYALAAPRPSTADPQPG